MRILKSLAHVLAVSLLLLVASVGIVAATVSLNVTNPEVVKSWPREAGTYNHLSDSLLGLVQHSGEGQGDTSLDESLQRSLLDSAGLAKVLSSELTPEYWQSKFEGMVDPVYAWLDGETAQPQFTLSFADKQKSLAKALEREIISQLREAPVCQNQPQAEFDIFTARCLPPGVSPAEAAKSFTNQLTGSDSPLSKPILTGQDLTQDSNQAPQVYRQAKTALWLAPLLVVLLVLAVGFSGKRPINGFRQAGQLLLAIGLISWVGFMLSQRFLKNFSLPAEENQLGGDLVATLVDPLFRVVATSFTATGMWVSLAVIISGILLWLGSYFWHKVHHGDEAKAIAEKSMKKKEVELPKPVKPAS